jgi:signal peptidase II
MNERRWFGLQAGASNWLWLSLVVIALDQWTKYLITDHLDEFEEVILLPVLELMRLHNDGAAFNLLSTASGWQR